MKPRVKCCALNSDSGPHFEILEAAGFEVLPGNRSLDYWDENSLIRELEHCVAVVAGSEPYTERVIASLPELRVIARTGVGYDAVDLKAADEHRVVVTTTPGVNHHSVAEHTIALLFGVARGFPDQDQRVRSGQWRRVERPRVMGSTIGIVGLGRIGKAVAERAVGLGMRVIGVEPFPDETWLAKWDIEVMELDEMLPVADYVTLHQPMSAENRHMFNGERFARMKRGSVIINTARGPLIDEQALAEALKSGHLRGAGLDVFEVEPLPLDSPLLQLDEVLLSGHVAGLDVESQRDTLVMAAETILAIRDGGWPDHCIQNLKGRNWDWSHAEC